MPRRPTPPAPSPADWRALVMQAACDPSLTKERAEVETLRVALGMASEGLANLGELSAMLAAHSRVKRATQNEGTGLDELVKALSEEDRKKRARH